jgi:hypothetical protein
MQRTERRRMLSTIRLTCLVAGSVTAGLIASASALGAEDAAPDWPSEIQALAVGLPTNPLTFVGIVPCRMADTRALTFPPGYGPPALPAGSPRNFVLTGRCGIPVDALAVSANVTAVSPQGPGFLQIQPTDGPSATVSTLNFIPGETVANGSTIPLGTAGGATFIAGVTGTELIIDVNGYYLPASEGDVTAVIAGPGLAGGGSSGDVALSVDAATVQTRVAGTCPAGQSIRTIGQDGSVACEIDDNTTYSSGLGLALVGTQFSVAGLGITSSMLATSAVTATKIATGAVTTAEIADNTVQRADINGTEVGLYTIVAAGCGGTGSFTLNPTCPTPPCAPPIFWDCSGLCVATVPTSCPNLLRGYLLSPSIP